MSRQLKKDKKNTHSVNSIACIKLLLFSIFLLLSTKNHAQPFLLSADMRFDNYSGNNTFVNEFIGNVYRDKRGYVWSCANGLYRFDGKKYKQYSCMDNRPNNLRNNYCVDLVEDNYNRLWVGNGGGLCYYDSKKDNFRYIQLNEKNDIHFAYYYSIIGNDLWFICDYGLCKLNLQTLKITQSCITNSQLIYGVFVVDDNTLLISNRADGYIYHIKENKYDIQPMLQGIGQGCFIKSNNKYWIGYTSGGIAYLNNLNDTPFIIPQTEILHASSIQIAPSITGDSILWITTTNTGIAALNMHSFKIEYKYTHDAQNPYSLQTNEVLQIHTDKEKLIWLATGTGISLLNFNNQGIKTRITPEKYVRKIIEDKYDSGKAYISFADHGLTKIDWGTQDTIKKYFSIRKNNIPYVIGSDILDMVQLGKNKWLLSKWQELLVWSPEHGVEKSVDIPGLGKVANSFLRYIIPVDQNRFYITCSQGLLLYNLNNNTLDYVLKRNDSNYISEYDLVNGIYDSSNTLWIASANGLLKYDLNTKTAKSYRYQEKKDTLVNIMRDVALDDNGHIYCTTAQGLAIFNIQHQTFTYCNQFNNIQNVACYALIIDKSIAWINSGAGLIKYNINTGKSAIIAFPFLPHFSVERFSKINDEIILHFRNAYAYFKPEKLLKQQLPSIPIIEQLVVNNKARDLSGNTNFNYDQNILNFSFTAFDFNDPENISFRYKLQGLDDQWSYADDQRNANYTKLPPGEYTFMVEAGYNGEWNETPSTYHFAILPPYWQTWWFRLLTITLFIGIVVSIAMLRIVQIKRKEANKTAVNKMVSELEMKVLRSQMNPHFIFNSLNSIQKFIWENKQEDASEYLTKFSKLMRSILDNSMHKYVTLEQELATLSLYIELEHRRSNNKFDYRITVDDTLDTTHTLAPPLILQPYVENAIWHGLLHKAGRGELKINILQTKDDIVEVIIEDNGVGRKASDMLKKQRESKSMSYGLSITEQRLSMIEHEGHLGKVTIEDIYDHNNIASGTRVIIQLPVATFVKV